jgi:hypothetical protein
MQFAQDAPEDCLRGNTQQRANQHLAGLEH